MNMLKDGFKWFVAVLAIAMLPTMSALAKQPVATPKAPPGHPGHIPPVPRALPDLTPYWNFDPPRSSLFDINKLTFSADMRVRPEMRTNGSFGITKSNDFYVQQWMRMGINYELSEDVDIFFQPQYAKNWGAASIAGTGLSGNCAANICANDPFNTAQGNSLFTRQAWLMIRNLGVQGLSLKAGRQLIVMGNHRLFGHFDWANTGFSHDGITLQYSQPMYEAWAGWLRPADQDFTNFGANSTVFGVDPPGLSNPTGQGTDASSDMDIFFTRLTFKPMAGLSIEPLWVYMINGTPGSGGTGAAGTLQAHAPNQNRHTFGARVAYRKGMLDSTVEGYWQTGSMGATAGNSTRNLRINATALAATAGLTLKNMPMNPRLGLEFNFASGDGDGLNCGGGAGGGAGSVAACNGSANTFENLYPTNHIVMGYMDLFAWRNMTAYSGSLKFKPHPTNHVEIGFWVFRKSNAGDAWYRAAQNAYFNQSATSSSLGRELDVIFTQFFKGNKVGWQVGFGHFWAGQFVQQVAAAANSGAVTGQNWAYTQLHVNF